MCVCFTAAISWFCTKLCLLGLLKLCARYHRWALSPISVISDIGLSVISELPISDWESGVRHYIGYRNKVLSDIRHPILHKQSQSLSVIAVTCQSKGRGFESAEWIILFLQCRISEWSQMSISEHFRYRNYVFQSDIFVSDIRITDVDVGYRRHWARCRCPPMQDTNYLWFTAKVQVCYSVFVTFVIVMRL